MLVFLIVSTYVPTYEKLDRVLASTEWEQKFPLVTVDALNREISEHSPLLLSTSEKVHMGNKLSGRRASH